MYFIFSQTLKIVVKYVDWKLGSVANAAIMLQYASFKFIAATLMNNFPTQHAGKKFNIRKLQTQISADHNFACNFSKRSVNEFSKR